MTTWCLMSGFNRCRFKFEPPSAWLEICQKVWNSNRSLGSKIMIVLSEQFCPPIALLQRHWERSWVPRPVWCFGSHTISWPRKTGPTFQEIALLKMGRVECKEIVLGTPPVVLNIIALCFSSYVSDGWIHSYKKIRDGSDWQDFSSFCGLKQPARKDPLDWTAKIGTPKLSRCRIRIKSWFTRPLGGIGIDSVPWLRKVRSHWSEHDIFSKGLCPSLPWHHEKRLKKVGLIGPNHQSGSFLTFFERSGLDAVW